MAVSSPVSSATALNQQLQGAREQRNRVVCDAIAETFSCGAGGECPGSCAKSHEFEAADQRSATPGDRAEELGDLKALTAFARESGGRAGQQAPDAESAQNQFDPASVAEHWAQTLSAQLEPIPNLIGAALGKDLGAGVICANLLAITPAGQQATARGDGEDGQPHGHSDLGAVAEHLAHQIQDLVEPILHIAGCEGPPHAEATSGMQGKRCDIRILDMAVVREWSKTCKEYYGFIKRPFGRVPPKQLVKCNQPDWEVAFQEWGVAQFWVGVVVAILGLLRDVILGENIVVLVVEASYRVVLAYGLAHLGWFGVVKKNGFCCCVIACCEWPPFLLIWGVWGMISGVMSVAGAMLHIFSCLLLCIIPAAFTVLHSLILLYMGVCTYRIWQARGSQQLVLPAVQVTGPEPTHAA